MTNLSGRQYFTIIAVTPIISLAPMYAPLVRKLNVELFHLMNGVIEILVHLIGRKSFYCQKKVLDAHQKGSIHQHSLLFLGLLSFRHLPFSFDKVVML